MIRNLLYLRYWTNFFLSISDVENHGLMKTFQVVDLCEPKVLSVTLLLLWIENGVEEKQYECNCCVMNGPRSFTASTATPPASSAATDLFRHTRLVDQSSSSGTAGINTDYTTEVGSTTQIHFFPTLNEKIQLFFFLHLNFFEALLIFAESCGVLEDFAALIWFSLEWIFILQKKREVEPRAQSAKCENFLGHISVFCTLRVCFTSAGLVWLYKSAS